MKNKIPFLALLLSTTGFVAQTQIGPGGVGSAADLKIWIDASSLSLVNGADVAVVADKSGNGNDFSCPSGKRPTFVASSSMNSRPAINFNGTTNYLASIAIPALNTPTVTWYTAFSSPSYGGEQTIFSTRHVGTSGFQLFYRTSISPNNPGTTTYSPNIPGLAKNVPSFMIKNYKAGSGNTLDLVAPYYSGTQVVGAVRSAGSFANYINGLSVDYFTGALYAPTAHQYCTIGTSSSTTGQFFKGLISEVIMYTKTLNETQNIILSNYLSSKYGKAMAANDKYTFESTHGENIAGIGRVSATDNHLSARGSEIIQVTSAGMTTDGTFMLWGSDGATYAVDSLNVPTFYSTTIPLGKRMTRTWRFQETGETGELTIRFDLSLYGFSPTPDYELLIDKDGNFSDADRYVGVFSGSFVTFTIPGSDLDDGDWVALGNPKQPIKSIVSGQDWSNPSTWNCSCIPNNTNSAQIMPGHTVTISGTQGISNLSVSPGGKLVIASTGALNVLGALDVLGLSDFHINSVVRFKGTTPQYSTCSTNLDFGKLTINNSTGVNFTAGNFSVRGLYRPDAGVLNITGSTLTFASSATQTASIGVWGAGANITGGTVRVQRFIAAGKANNRDITSPLIDFKLQEWDDEIRISGVGFPDGCSWSGGKCYNSARTWNPAGAGAYVPITSLTTVIPRGKGIEIFLGDNLSTFSATTLTSSGTISNAASVNISVVKEWNLIGNPFMSSIKFGSCTKGAGIGNYYYVLNPNTNTNDWYDASNNTSSNASLLGGRIASHQGFWVYKSTAGSVNFTVNQACKDTAATDNFMKSNLSDIPAEFFKIQLSASNREYIATTIIKRGDNFLAEMDEYDLPKFPYATEDVITLYSKTKDGNDVVVNAIGTDDDCMIIPLYFDAPVQGEYTLSLANIPMDYEVDLYDRVTKTFVKLSLEQQEVVFNQEIEMGVHRYDLRITKNVSCAPMSPSDFNTAKLYASGTAIVVEYDGNESGLVLQVVNLTGQIVSQYPVSSNAYFKVNSNLEDGLYLVNLIDPNTNLVIKTEKVFINR